MCVFTSKRYHQCKQAAWGLIRLFFYFIFFKNTLPTMSKGTHNRVRSQLAQILHRAIQGSVIVGPVSDCRGDQSKSGDTKTARGDRSHEAGVRWVTSRMGGDIQGSCGVNSMTIEGDTRSGGAVAESTWTRTRNSSYIADKPRVHTSLEPVRRWTCCT